MSKISTRSAYGEALAEIGADENIIVPPVLHPH